MSEGPQPGPAKVPGQTPERVSFFTDAVFAIAMTLLVIDIPRPEGADFGTGDGVSKSEAFSRLAHFLGQQYQDFYAYFLAFLILWIIWREHHRLFDQYSRVSPRMMAWHFPLLLFSAFLPYASSTYGHYGDNPMAALLFGGVVAVMFVSRTVIQAYALRGDVLFPWVDRARYRDSVTVSWIVVGYWLLTLSLVWLTPWVGIPWAFTSQAGSLGRRIVRQRRRPEAAVSGGAGADDGSV
jgi:uncharacterized membrane protein